jgi:hypothetical protein
MSFFTYEDHTRLAQDDYQLRCQDLQTRFMDLHNAVYERLRLQSYDLHPHWQKSRLISDISAAAANEGQNVLVLSYFRAQEQARLVEELMGIEQSEVEPYRHPVIELRMAPDYFAIELVLSPYAWWDQQNFIGKFELERHRHALRQLFFRFGADYRFGFWGGEASNDMHLTPWQLLQGRVMNEWIDTFADGQDWLRFGSWYEPEHEALSASRIVNEISQRVGELYSLYDYILWTSNNNYHEFYKRRVKPGRRMYA